METCDVGGRFVTNIATLFTLDPLQFELQVFCIFGFYYYFFFVYLCINPSLARIVCLFSHLYQLHEVRQKIHPDIHRHLAVAQHITYR